MWKFGSNLRHADDIVCCTESPEDADSLIGKVNYILVVKARLLKLNVKHTERLKIGKIQLDARVIVGRGVGPQNVTFPKP